MFEPTEHFQKLVSINNAKDIAEFYERDHRKRTLTEHTIAYEVDQQGIKIVHTFYSIPDNNWSNVSYSIRSAYYNGYVIFNTLQFVDVKSPPITLSDFLERLRAHVRHLNDASQLI